MHWACPKTWVYFLKSESRLKYFLTQSLKSHSSSSRGKRESDCCYMNDANLYDEKYMYICRHIKSNVKKIALFASKNFKKFFSNSLLRTDWRMEIERDWSRPPVRICEHIFFRIRLYVHT